jgi:3-phytase
LPLLPLEISGTCRTGFHSETDYRIQTKGSLMPTQFYRDRFCNCLRLMLTCFGGAGLSLADPHASAEPLLLNEIYVNPPGNTLPYEYIELKGTPLAPLDGYFLLAINGNPGTAGRADLVLNLNGVLLGTNGLLVVKVSRDTGFTVPQETRVISDSRFIDTAVSPLNNNSLSVLLVQSGAAPVEGTDYDANNDGLFDVAPLATATIVDAIGIRQLAGDPVYGGARIPNVGADNRPEAIVRLYGDTRASNADAWFGGRMNGTGLTVSFNAQVTTNFPAGATLTPGKENIVFSALSIVQSGSTTDVDEDGVIDTYTLALGANPSSGVVVVSVSADTQLQISLDGVNFVSQTNLTFTSANGTVPQTITVRAVDDTIAEAGHTHGGVITHRVISSDDSTTFPVTLPPVSIIANIFDNDSLLPIVQATMETPAQFDPADSDDPAVWIHPGDSSRSLLITTKKFGGATVFDFNLNILQSIAPITNGALRLNNVDVLYGFPLNGISTDLAVFSDRVNDTLYVYRIDPNAAANPLVLVSADLTSHIFAGSIVGGDTAYGLCVYKSPLNGRSYAFVSRNGLSQIAQLELIDAGGGQVGWQHVRTIALPDPRQVEGMVADQELGWVYLAQEKVGLWKFPAEPARASDGGVLLQRVKPAGTVLAADVEGLCIYYSTMGAGYLLASSQGDNTFAVFSRDGTNAHLGSFVIGANKPLGIDQVTTCDGADVMPLPLPNFPQGVLVVHDGENDGSVSVKNTNFKLVPWDNVASGFSPALAITPSGFNPRSPANRVPARLDHISLTVGEVRLSLSGGAGTAVDLQTSEDLANWETLQGIVFTTPFVEVTNSTALPAWRFYRLTLR